MEKNIVKLYRMTLALNDSALRQSKKRLPFIFSLYKKTIQLRKLSQVKRKNPL